MDNSPSSSLSKMGRALRRVSLIALLSILIATIVAAFLSLLDEVTAYRFGAPWLIYLLPVAGIALAFLYKKWGLGSELGRGLLIARIKEDRGVVPHRMGPLVFIGTLITHLFGGSAGREGTAVQVGGGLGHTLATWLRLSKGDRDLLIFCGMGAGFGAVFGTPIAGALFAIELVGTVTRHARSILPVLFAALIGDAVCRLWGIQHTHYRLLPLSVDSSTLLVSAKIIAAALAFGLCAFCFTQATLRMAKFWDRISPHYWVKPVLGALLVIGLYRILSTDAYLGLGVSHPNPLTPSLINAFHEGGVTPWSWLWKFIFTVLTLSAGFRGGEATPLFFIGACLGAALAAPLGLPVDLAAGLGFIAVFAAEAKTPIAGTVMGAELFGSQFSWYFALACFIAFAVRKGFTSNDKPEVH